MPVVLAFAVTLLVAVLVSAFASRSVLSTAVLFLLAGFGLSAVGLPAFERNGSLSDTAGVFLLSELALFSVLFTDGMRLGVRDLTRAWRLPGRALLFGMPLTFAGTTVLAALLTGLGWVEAFLLGAALAPTDPVFASAIVGREEISPRLRNLLNVESGLNDGLALPVVLVLLAAAGGSAETTTALTEVATGIALGVGVPLVAVRLEQLSFLRASEPYEPLGGFAIGLVVFALGSVLHANLFIAAFAAGITVATTSPETVARFQSFGELVTELLKLAALLLFGLLIDPAFLGEISVGGYVLAVLVIVLVRPVALSIALAGDRLPRGELAAASWFGPKGFASVVYGLLILRSDIPAADELFHLIAVTVAISIVAHSSTDVLVSRWLARLEEPSTPPHRA